MIPRTCQVSMLDADGLTSMTGPGPWFNEDICCPWFRLTDKMCTNYTLINQITIKSWKSFFLFIHVYKTVSMHGSEMTPVFKYYQHRKSHCGDKIILRPPDLHDGISYTGKTTYLYWIRVQGNSAHNVDQRHWDQLPVISGLIRWDEIRSTIWQSRLYARAFSLWESGPVDNKGTNGVYLHIWFMFGHFNWHGGSLRSPWWH